MDVGSYAFDSMKFEETIQKLQPLFNSHNFKTIERRQGFIHLQSDLVSIRLGHDWRDNSISLFAGQINGQESEIDEKTMKDVFNHLSRDDNNKSPLQNIIDFLNGNGRLLLTGDINKLRELEVYSSTQAKLYTDNLILKQNIALADKAWSNKNYKQFLRHIEAIDPSYLPKSYHLKYKIASDKSKL